ncbi:pseudouridine synthase [Salegentibacter salinarum]|uniref:tRNA pseudouridine synthase A n=1 Tax=Salegentibacter salinarum TaxID=447422 RepID=A0A2N0TWI4_9FLAO|nr:tRNA pseudouridine(38-40) synthase TruA [Salegentibacter salinarum]PKD19122.1 pseudouridine synthase [Salegentibacter salinarum]SKB95276.1 tRNA pseudouridine38-40 synthase [Salegentibacter salinarum]
MRYFLELAYFGKAYHGWQNQPNAISVQEEIEKALAIIFQRKTDIVGAGRTDAGVHAKQIFAHFEVEAELDKESFLFKLNSLLPADIALKDVFKVKPDAHARFDAYSRSYEYHIVQHKDPFLEDRSYFLKNKLDVEKMNQAAEILKDYTNFKCFSKSKTDVKTYNCKISEAIWKTENEVLVFHISADRFLRNMVRAIVGTLLEIGFGKQPVENMHEIIKSKDRSKAGTSVPAKALYLTRVTYPEIALK